MSTQQQRTVFYISDGTGITAETIGKSVLCQFPGIQFNEVVLPYINNTQQAHKAVQKINDQAEQDQSQPLVMDTLVSQELRAIINTANAINLDIFEGVIGKISHHLNISPSPIVGNSHSRTDSKGYKTRMDAVHFALDNDDGAQTKHYDMADLILIGVSRSGKTPTSLYLAMQYGIRTANYPITEDDLDNPELPSCLQGQRHKIFGLMISVERLVAIRNERKAGSRYASFSQCEMELRAIEAMYQRYQIPYLNITEMSVEEISTRILLEKGMTRNQTHQA